MIIIFYILLNDFYKFAILIYCVKCFFLMQPDFKTQKCKIKELIIQLTNRKHYFIMYYPK